MTHLLFAAGDVGGARALLPVARAAHARGWTVQALDHGVFRTEGAPDWTWLTHTQSCDAARTVDAVLYATSVADPRAFQVAQAAQTGGRLTLHVLDNWSNYESRLHSGPDTLVPGRYAVMDDLAYREAVDEGVSPDILRVTGHPNLAALGSEAGTIGATYDPNRVLFVSEPARIDNGSARGYDEVSVTHSFAQAWANRSTDLAKAHVMVAPHPREDRDAISARWDALAAQTDNLSWSLVPADGVRTALHSARAVFGMSSILLYEAWLLGKPVASLQPGLVGTGLRTLSHREGLQFCDAQADFDRIVQDTLQTPHGPHNPDLVRHTCAAEQILDITAKLAS